MAKQTLDRGPVAPFAVPGVEAAIPNIGVAVVDRSGPIKIIGIAEITNPAANTPLVDLFIALNGVSIAATNVEIIMNGASTQVMVVVHIIDNPAVGDVFTLRVVSTSAAAGHQVGVNRASLLVEGVGLDGAEVAGIGPVTA